MAKVFLDAGHGGNVTGAVYNGRYEKNDNLNLVLEIGRILSENGVDVQYTRTSDVYLSPIERIALANQEGGDLFVAIHRADSPIPDALTGVRASIYTEGGPQQEAAENIIKNLEEIGFKSFGIRIVEDYVVLRDATMPALMIDIGFINSSYDNYLFDTRFHDIAVAIASGILQALGIQQINITMCTKNNRSYTDSNQYRYRVEVGIVTLYNNAMKLQDQLLLQGLPAGIVKQGNYYAIHAGDYSTLDEAVILEWILRNKGYNTLLVAI